MRKKNKTMIPEDAVNDAAAEEQIAAADVDAIMRKYDRESNTRIWTGVWKKVVGFILARLGDRL